MKIQFSHDIPTGFKGAVLCAFEEEGLTPRARDIDLQLNSLVSDFIKRMGFKPKISKTLTLGAVAWEGAFSLAIVGCGERSTLSEQAAWEVGGYIYTAAQASATSDIFVVLDGVEVQHVASMAAGFKLRSWIFDKYKTKTPEEERPSVQNVTFVCQNPESASAFFKALQAVVEGACFTRALVSEPANVIDPETLAQQAHTLTQLGIKVDVFSEAQLREMGMHALVGVGAGSEKDTKMVIMQWLGAEDKTQQPLSFIGKGITFDSGGISLKPAKGMEDMKWDMSGAAVVIGLMKTLALRQAKVNVVGALALAENMPSGAAQRPGDIVKSYSGQTIEILNTDAEGRLVLADVLWYVQQQYKPKFMIDLATLTGAIIVTLGHEYAGLFSNDEQLIAQLKSTSQVTGEKIWHLPLNAVFDKEIDSSVADVKNIGNNGAGSIIAAQFLQRFVNETPWAHLDIAGVAWSDKDRALCAKGATAFGVRLLNQLVQDYYEDKNTQ